MCADHVAETGVANRCRGASILPFSVDPRFNAIYFWLGQEQYCRAWHRGSLHWSDFGGGIDDVDDGRPERCAAREFQEETMSCIPVSDSENSLSDQAIITSGTRPDAAWIASSLMLGRYCTCVKTTNTRDGTYYAMYVVQVPWRPSATHMFSSCRNNANVPGLGEQHPGHGNDTFLEKSRIRLWGAQQLRQALHPDTRPYNRIRLRRTFRSRLATVLTMFPNRCVYSPGPSVITLETYHKTYDDGRTNLHPSGYAEGGTRHGHTEPQSSVSTPTIRHE